MQKIIRKTLLYRSGAEYADFCINHVEGCAHGCRFPCYAMIMKKRCGRIKDYNDWIKPKLVANALELLEKELPQLKDKIGSVHLCFTTDPFMYQQPEVSKLTLKIISRLNCDNIKCVVLTKGIYPRELANTKKYGLNNEYGITLISLNRKFKKEFEPYAAPYNKRIEALKFLHSKGLKTWISMEAYPTPNLVMQDLEEILGKIKFVDRIVFGKLNYNAKSSQFIGNQRFYQENVDLLKNFCKKNKIQYHIKFGTDTRNYKKIEKIGAENQIRKLGGILPIPI